VRRGVAGLVNPFPVGRSLPAIYHDDDLVQAWCASLDEGLAPVVATLDCLPAYLDPATTPPDMLDWLAGWVGVVLEPGQSEARQRELVAAGVGLLTWRGTVKGVCDAVEVLLGVVPEVEETGGSEWSTTPGAPLPGAPGARLTVRVTVPDAAAVDRRRLEDLVVATKPAHVRHEVEVRGAA
jgi:phage tail-like protein